MIRKNRGYSVAAPNSQPVPSICVATLVPHNVRGTLPNYNPLSIAFCRHEDDDHDGSNTNACAIDYEDWVGGGDLMYRALADREARYDAQLVANKLENVIGKRDCLQVIELRENTHKTRSNDGLSSALVSGQNALTLWRSRYGITCAPASRSKMIHVHALRPSLADGCGINDTHKVFSYEALQCILQHRHGRYWMNHTVIIQDVHIPGDSCVRWVEHTVNHNCDPKDQNDLKIAGTLRFGGAALPRS